MAVIRECRGTANMTGLTEWNPPILFPLVSLGETPLALPKDSLRARVLLNAGELHRRQANSFTPHVFHLAAL